MLISTDLEALGDILKPTNKENMVTKGVPSVPSPVCNLCKFDASVTHEAFTDAVVGEFRSEYRISDEDPCCVVGGDEEALTSIDYMSKGMAELPSWEWCYGQTPEFTYTVSHSFRWGDVMAKIRSKHGIILSCAMEIENTWLSSAELERLHKFGESLENKRYDLAAIATAHVDNGQIQELVAWLQDAVAN